MNMCFYGCRQEGIYQLKNRRWCCSKSQNSCPAIRKKNKENHADVSGSKNPMYRKHHTEESKKKNQENHKGKLSKNKGRKYPKEFGENLSKVISIQFKNGRESWNKGLTKETSKILKETAKKISSSKQNMSEETRIKIGIGSQRKFLDPNFLKKFNKVNNAKPNKPEIFLTKILEEFQFKYTGNYSFWINGKNPDFTNENKKKVIEYFGGYWHDEKITGKSRKDHQKEREEHFRKEGFMTLVLWEEDLKDHKKLTGKIKDFVK